eukprot:gene20934-25111_t
MSTGEPQAPGHRRKFDDEGKLRKVSGRLFAEPQTSSHGLRRSSRISTASGASPGGKPPVSRRFGQSSSQGPQPMQGGENTPVSNRHYAGPSSSRLGLQASAWQPIESGKTFAGATATLALIRILGQGFRQLCTYKCKDAIETLRQLNRQQYATGWVLCTVGRAFFEMVDYAEAEKAFEWARRIDPTRLEGLEVFSTVLWHLKKE